jgi:exodeoxyribonuclease V alpha subunit
MSGSTSVIERFETDDPHDPRLASTAVVGTLLHTFNRAGVLVAADVHVAQRACALVGEHDGTVALAVALAVRAVRQGSVCLDLADLVRSDAGPEAVLDTDADAGLPWPVLDGWLERVAASPLVAASVVHVDGPLLYLDRYWREEGQVRSDLLVRSAAEPPAVHEASLVATAERLFPGASFAEQRAAALGAARQWTTVLTGGPGTGKTTTVAGLLALLAEQAERTGAPLRIALTAPTGKAAARLQEAVREAQTAARFDDDDRSRLAGVTSSTLHRLLGWRPESRTRFRHHRGNKLPHDVVVVDETSMVSLTMMARLVESVRPGARLVLVGDPDQLASVEAGAVLHDLVDGLEQRVPGSVVQLRTTHRYGEQIGALAEALRAGDGPAVLELLRAGADGVELVEPDDAEGLARLTYELRSHALAVRTAALEGDAEAALAAMDAHRLLCAHREGPHGVRHWNAQVERWLAEATGEPVGASWGPPFYVGRPLLLTANDHSQGLFNGDTGVVVRDPSAADGVRAVVAGIAKPFATSRLADVETLHAMTVHKSQGSQARRVTVLLPPEDSPLLTRELFYTAVTRAEEHVRVVAGEASVLAAVQRRALRATGLQRRLASG